MALYVCTYVSTYVCHNATRMPKNKYFDLPQSVARSFLQTYVYIIGIYTSELEVLLFEVFKVQSIPAATKMHSTASF